MQLRNPLKDSQIHFEVLTFFGEDVLLSDESQLLLSFQLFLIKKFDDSEVASDECCFVLEVKDGMVECDSFGHNSLNNLMIDL